MIKVAVMDLEDGIAWAGHIVRQIQHMIADHYETSFSDGYESYRLTGWTSLWVEDTEEDDPEILMLTGSRVDLHDLEIIPEYNDMWSSNIITQETIFFKSGNQSSDGSYSVFDERMVRFKSGKCTIMIRFGE